MHATTVQGSYAVGTTLSGDSVTVAAGHDLTTRAAQVAGTHDVTLAAGHDVTLGTAEEVSTETYSVARKKSGLFSGGGASGLGGIGVTAGSQKANATDTVEQHLTVGSLIGSTEGNLTVAAGGDLAVIGSDLIAQRAEGASSGGNIALQSNTITITTATQTDHETTTQQTRSHGLTMAMVGTARDGLRNVQQTRREQAGSGKKAQDTLHAVSAAGLDMPGIAISYGSQRSDQSSQVDTTTERGSTLRAAGDLTMDATGGDLTVIGSALSAGGTATLAAQRNVALLTSVDTQSSSSQRSNHSQSFTAAPVGWGDAARSLQGGANSSGVSMSPYNSQSGTTQNGQQIVNQTGTAIDAGQISVISQQGNITAEGAQLTAQHDINLLASQGKIDLGTAESSQHQQNYQRSHQVGDLGGNGYAGTIGERQELHDQSGSQTWQSTLRTGLTSTQGDVNVIAHGDLTGQGVDIAGRDVTLVGRNVTLTPSADTAEQQQRDKMSQAGVTVALSGVAVQAAQAVDAAVDAHDRGDNRLAALYAAEAYYGAKDAGTAAGEIDYGRAAQSATGHAANAAPAGGSPDDPNGSAALVKVTVSIGSSHQSSNTSYQQQTQQGSTVNASRDVTIVATGDGTKDADGYAANGDVTLQGAQIQAGRDATLAAARDITLTAGQDTTERDSANHSGSASIGVGFALGGEQNGFTIELAAAAARGKGNGDSTTNHATTVNAGDLLSLQSGRNTTLEGAQAYGNTILADIGRSLSLTSTQDTDHYKETYQSASAGLSLCIPPICYGATSGGASYSQSNISNNYQSVTDQTGLAAGSGGFDIHVGDTTTLTGAAIASTADPSKNLLDTGNLVVNDLHNSAHSSASQMGFSYSSSGSAGSNLASNAMGAALNMAIPQGGSDSSDTQSSIAQGTIVVRNNLDQDLSGIDRSATTLDGNGVSNDFDVDKIKENQALGQAAGYVGMRAAGDLADRMYAEAAASGDKEAMAAWSDGGTYKVLLHGLVGAATAELGGGDALQGALGAAASEKASGAMANYLAEHHIDPNGAEGKTLMQLASAAIGGVVGGGAGAVTALDGEKYNRELHPDYVKHLQSQAKAFAEQECGCTLSQLPQDQQDEWLDNATNALLVTAQRLQDDNFNASFDGAPLDAAAEAFLQTDSFGEWIGGTYYDMSHANAEQRADPNINGYALYQQLNSDDNGGLGALMSATGYSMEQYYVLGRNDYYSGEPQSQAMDETIYQAQQQSGKGFLNFQAGIIANAFVMATTAGIGNAAMEVYGGTRVGTVLKYALTSRGGMALTNSGINAVAQAAEHDGKINWVDVGTTAATSYLGAGRNLGWNMALGASGGVVGTEYANWSEGKDDSVLASGLTNGLATGIGFGVVDPMTKSLLEKYPGTFWPVAWGNLTGDAITEYVNYKIEQADKLGEKVGDDKSNSSMSK